MSSWKNWVCSKCGHEVLAIDRPSPIRWTDGHVCLFVEMPEPDEDDIDYAYQSFYGFGKKG